MKFTRAYLVFFVVSFLYGCGAMDTFDISNLGFAKPEETKETGTGTKVLAGAGGCAVGGGAAYLLSKKLGQKLQEKNSLIPDKEVKELSVYAAGLGCIVGGKIALNIIKNMDAKSKAAQEEAWQALLADSDNLKASEPKKAWSTSTHKGEVSITKPKPTPDGRQCATRRNYVADSTGEAEQYIVVCKNSSGVYVPQKA